MKKERVELSSFGGSKRRKLASAIDEALEELGLYSEEYFEQNNEVDLFRDHLSEETINDTQAVVVIVGKPNIVQNDYLDAIYSDEELGAEGGYERVVRNIVIGDLGIIEEVHILLTFDI